MKTILVPSDFSKNATTALRYAIRLSRLLKAELVVFHCAHLSTYILAASSATDAQMNLLIEEDHAFKMKKLLSQVKKAYKYVGLKKIPASTKILVESKTFLIENIMELAEKFHADLIVTGTHGATGLNRYFFGSNTATLISRSRIPVLAIPEKYRYNAIRNIAFSSDLENLTDELNRLVPFAQAIRSNIDILYLDYGIDIDQAHMRAAKACISNIKYKKIKLISQKATIEYSLVNQLKKYLAKHRHQWLVMFTKDRKFWDKILFGGKTELMSYSLKIPLLSFKKS
jgi:nucleotide-binding universal stress UspA family protein